MASYTNIFSAGNESIAVVEFAPFQKVPNEKKKADSRAGTIEKGSSAPLNCFSPPVSCPEY